MKSDSSNFTKFTKNTLHDIIKKKYIVYLKNMI